MVARTKASRLLQATTRALGSKLAQGVFFVTLSVALLSIRPNAQAVCVAAVLLVLCLLLVCGTASSRRLLTFEWIMSVNTVKHLFGCWTWFNLIDEHLYLGATPLNPNDAYILTKKLQVNAVLCALPSGDVEDLRHESLFGSIVSSERWKELGVAVEHMPQASKLPTIDTLLRAAAHINLHLSENRRIYVYCHTGQSTSALFALAYMIKHRGFTLGDAYDRIQRKRGLSFSLRSPEGARLAEYELAVRG